MKAAIAVAADEASRGTSGAVLEARVEDGTDVLARYIVALSVEPLQLTSPLHPIDPQR